MLIDTEREVVLWGSSSGLMPCSEGYRRDLIPKDVDDDGPDWWMNRAIFAVEDLFELWKQYFGT